MKTSCVNDDNIKSIAEVEIYNVLAKVLRIHLQYDVLPLFVRKLNGFACFRDELRSIEGNRTSAGGCKTLLSEKRTELRQRVRRKIHRLLRRGP